MVALFEGKYYWKMPADVEMDVGPTIMRPLPKAFREAGEKYGSQTRVVHLPDGRMNIENFIAGFPFPNPQEPDKGYKILTNIWFPPAPICWWCHRTQAMRVSALSTVSTIRPVANRRRSTGNWHTIGIRAYRETTLGRMAPGILNS